MLSYSTHKLGEQTDGHIGRHYDTNSRLSQFCKLESLSLLLVVVLLVYCLVVGSIVRKFTAYMIGYILILYGLTVLQIKIYSNLHNILQTWWRTVQQSLNRLCAVQCMNQHNNDKWASQFVTVLIVTRFTMKIGDNWGNNISEMFRKLWDFRRSCGTAVCNNFLKAS